MKAVGVYSVMAYAASERTHELGVRVAFGARAADVLRMLLGEGLRLVVIGAAAGAVLVLALGPTLDPLLYQVSARDPLVMLAAGAVLVLAALAATLTPAWRAARADPVRALAAE